MNSLISLLKRNLAPSIPLLKTRRNAFLPQFYHAVSQHALQQLGVKNIKPQLLLPVQPIVVPSCGFKMKDKLRKRCRDCFIVVKDRQAMVLCNTHPRHKQLKIVPKEKDTWIITHRTHGPIRPW